MIKFGRAVVKCRHVILILAAALLFPAVLGILHTRINYDMLNYLPDDMDTVKGQDILMEDFGKGAFSFVIAEGMTNEDVAALKKDIEAVEHVETVLWYDSLFDMSVPMELLPDRVYEAFCSGSATMMAVFFDTSTSADETIEAIKDIRSAANEQCFISGMSAMVTDLRDLCEQEEPIYVGLAVLLACAAMMLFMDSWLIPFVFLASIGVAILLNLGTNIFLGEISYITKALSAVLQLAVTMDYSIFLWHSYSEQKVLQNGNKKEAMARAVADTLTSVVGSSVTTIAGFIALCFMSFSLGRDLGIVMAKGVLFGVIGCVTTLPALILLFDRPIEKTKHKRLMPSLDKMADFITGHSPLFLILFVLILVPAFFGYEKAGVYYDLSESLPDTLDYAVANQKLQDEFDVGATHMILADANLPVKETKAMIKEIDAVEGVNYTLGLESIVGSRIPREMLPESVVKMFQSDRYQLLLVNTAYKVASGEMNEQIDEINGIIKEHDENGMLIGEAPCTKDMIEVTDHDFQVVSLISILAIFVIIALVLKSVTLPFLLVAVIEFAVFINLGIPYYTDTLLPFVAPICISTIQLGATVDYAILMTTRYKKERFSGLDKRTSVTNALKAAIPSVLVSAMGFFAATFGVALYSDIDIISSMCNLMARGAIVSMLSVIFVLPSLFMVLDRVICATSIGFKRKTAK